MTKRDLQKKETKKKIFNTAIQLFTKQGFDNVSIEKICQECNLAKGTFYVHYKSKSEILIEKYAEIDSLYLKRYEEIHKLNYDKTTKFKLYITAIYESIQKYFGIDMIQTLYVHHLKQYDYEILLSENRFFYTSIKSFFEDLANEYNFTEDELYLTNLFLSSMRGNIFDWAISNGEIDLVEIGTKRTSLMLDWIIEYYSERVL